MSKTLNIELNVRRMEAQNILTASAKIGDPTSDPAAPARQGGAAEAAGNGGVAPVRAGF